MSNMSDDQKTVNDPLPSAIVGSPPIPEVRQVSYRDAMQHSSLIAFLDGAISPEQFSSEIANEVAEFRASINATRHGRIFITNGPEALMTRDRVRRLLASLVGQALSFEAANYTADCIIMSDTFDWEDDFVREAVHSIADEDPPPKEDELYDLLRRLG
jgi:hypothetical protein